MRNIDVDTSGFDQFVEMVQSTASAPVTAAISVDGPAQAYWAVCEYGSAKGHRPWPNAGPRTVESGGRVYSSQARGGFVFKNSAKFIGFLKAAYLRVATKGKPASKDDLVAAANDAAGQAYKLIVAGAPYDSGELKSDIKLESAK